MVGEAGLGLLGGVTRDCLRGHGPMAKAEGLFGLPQMTIQPANKPSGLLSGEAASGSGRLVSTGNVFSVRVYVCRTCGALEMVDSDKV